MKNGGYTNEKDDKEEGEEDKFVQHLNPPTADKFGLGFSPPPPPIFAPQ